MSSRLIDELPSMTDSAMSQCAPNTYASLPPLGSLSLTAHLPSYCSSSLSTSLPHRGLTLLPVLLPPLKGREYQSFRDLSHVPQPATEPTALPSIHSLFSSAEIQEQPPRSRACLRIQSSHPTFTYADHRYISGEHYTAPVAESDSPNSHPQASAPYYPRSFSTSDIAPTGLGNGLPTRLSAPAPVPSILNSQTRRTVNASGTCQSFSGLETDLIEHPILPLLVKEVDEVCTGNELIVPNCAIKLSTAESDASTVKNFAYFRGIKEACDRCSPADVYLNACVCTLEDLKQRSLGAHVPPTLQDTINACAYGTVGDSRSETNNASLRRENRDIGGLSSLAGHKHLVPVRAVSISYAKSSPVGTRKRPRLRSDAVADMKDWCVRNIERKYPTKEEKKMFEKKWGISYKQVNTFLYNRRRRSKSEFESISKNRKYTNQRYSTPGSNTQAGALTQGGKDADF